MRRLKKKKIIKTLQMPELPQNEKQNSILNKQVDKIYAIQSTLDEIALELAKLREMISRGKK